jgi:glycerol-3-phosphate dehydrogenase
LTLRTGLVLYAMLGGLNHASRFRKLSRNEWGALDGLDTRTLQVVYQYFDAQTNDVELTRAVMQSAVQFGATLRCPAEFLSARVGQHGCEILYREHGHEKSCSARVLVNAGGPWVNTIAARISPTPAAADIDLVQGTHLLLDGRLEKGCYYLEAPQDRRAIFLLPWGHQSLLGTTESLYSGDPAAVTPLQSEVDYLLEAMQHYFPNRTQHVADMFAGVRVLPAADSAAFKRTRETQLPVDDRMQPRVLSIAGGKLTGYRATAQKVMKRLRRSLPTRKPRADTSTLALKPVT